ncbi:hypothetical protein PITCH_A1190005 [uncultured Desulfobacterium sp.]|uniref:Uncharacterized protein n=1 Tax=uncultured Desulfobacterium sp. TaxID=201089 RepID=A0A445MRR8_9BACT|nr:hypothetical protein PITCH_A1190005 [uncultured Desulfobacterium sp.]
MQNIYDVYHIYFYKSAILLEPKAGGINEKQKKGLLGNLKKALILGDI